MERLEQRGYYVLAFVGLILLIYIGRLFSIQVLSDDYANRAENIVVRTQKVVPPRGNIYNRDGDIYVDSRPMFTLQVTPSELSIPDTAALCKLLEIDQEELETRLKKIFSNPSARFQQHTLIRYLEPHQYGALKELFWNFSGLTFQASNKRHYQTEVGANVLGYIREVNRREIEENEEAYSRGDLIGNSGIERSYDENLRGENGVQRVLMDNRGRVVGLHQNTNLNDPVIRGKDIMLGIDTDLQALGEQLMTNKKGSIVAIDPASGEILAFISSPTYNPSTLTGKQLDSCYRQLTLDPNNPLFNRPLMAKYPPGSIFKVAMALAALDAGIIDENTYYRCGGGFWRNKGKPGCRMHVTPLKIDNAIKYSCNSYFAATYMDYLHHPKFDSIYEAYDSWYGYMSRMGIGHPLEIDLPYEKGGSLPTAAMYDDTGRWYGHNRWSATTIISNAIGQGEIEMTPLQMANLAALVANRGKYYPPHFRKATRNHPTDAWVMEGYDLIHTGIDVRHVETVMDAMQNVVTTGTGRRAYLEGYGVCGKTGTVENSHGEDHATFIGFAPRENPTIAIAVIIENAGGGGTWAAPTAAILMEQFLTGTIEQKKWEMQRILAADFIEDEE